MACLAVPEATSAGKPKVLEGGSNTPEVWPLDQPSFALCRRSLGHRGQSLASQDKRRLPASQEKYNFKQKYYKTASSL